MRKLQFLVKVQVEVYDWPPDNPLVEYPDDWQHHEEDTSTGPMERSPLERDSLPDSVTAAIDNALRDAEGAGFKHPAACDVDINVVGVELFKPRTIKARLNPYERRIKLTGLPSTFENVRGLPTELDIEVRYVGESRSDYGVSLDNIVIPAIVSALNEQGVTAD